MASAPAATRLVTFRGDGEPRTPAETIAALAAYEARHGIEKDDVSRGGAVELLERTLAEALGKEAAIFLPTGTLANHLAVRRLAGTRGRVVVQAEGHLYRDTGDTATRLSGLNLVPLAPGRPCFTLDELAQAFDDAEEGRVLTPVGAVVVESPVRRQHGRTVSLDEMRRIVDLCHARGTPVHYDGARVYMQSAASGVPVRELCAPFDTVYVSLYKYFGAPFGAILAGSADFVDGLYHERRMMGGGLASAWVAAALALEGFAGFEPKFAAAIARGRELVAALRSVPDLSVDPFPDGSNIYPLRGDLDTHALAAAGIHLGERAPEGFYPLTINATVLRRPLDELVEAFATSRSR